MTGVARVEVVRRVGAAVVAVVGIGTATLLLRDGSGAMVADGLRAMLGEGPGSAIGAMVRALRADGLPALTLALGLVPAVALVLVAACRPDRRSTGSVATLSINGIG